MEKAAFTFNVSKKPTEWHTYYTKCEKVKSDLALYSKDLRFLQQLLDRYFDEMVKNEHLDEMRESLIRFQDLCYDCDRLKKRVKDQQGHLLDIIKGTSSYNNDTILKEQSSIENGNVLLEKDFKSVKKEILKIAEYVLQKKRDNESFVQRT